MAETNQCRWLMIGRIDSCGKNCVYKHCRQHRAQLRKITVEPKPCRKCGVGTQSESRLCKSCGANRVQHKRVYKEHQASLICAVVLYQLKGSYHQLNTYLPLRIHLRNMSTMDDLIEEILAEMSAHAPEQVFIDLDT